MAPYAHTEGVAEFDSIRTGIAGGIVQDEVMLPDALQRLPFLRRAAARFPIAGELTAPGTRTHRVGVVLHATKPDAAENEAVIRALVADAGWAEPRIYPTTQSSFGEEQAAEALADGCDLVIACGGDGTVRMAAHALRHTGVPLGIVPSGTANIFARNLLLPLRDRRAAAHVALHGSSAPVDLGRATLTVDGEQEEHLFLVLTGIGNDAATVLGTDERLKQRFGWFAYAASAAQHALRSSVPMTVVYPANPPREIRAWSVIAGSCGKVPGGIEIFPGAVIDDGVLDVMEVTVAHPLQWLPIGAKGLLHLRAGVPGLQHVLMPELSVIPASPLPVQVDGDVIENVDRLDVSVDHRALAVRVASPHQ